MTSASHVKRNFPTARMKVRVGDETAPVTSLPKPRNREMRRRGKKLINVSIHNARNLFFKFSF